MVSFITDISIKSVLLMSKLHTNYFRNIHFKNGYNSYDYLNVIYLLIHYGFDDKFGFYIAKSIFEQKYIDITNKIFIIVYNFYKYLKYSHFKNEYHKPYHIYIDEYGCISFKCLEISGK